MHFAVLGTANIARVVIPAIRAAGHEVVAVGSRDADRAAAYAGEMEIDRSYGSYEGALDDEGVEAVYVPTPNAAHARWTRAAADRGLAVLCEKPLAANAMEAAALGEYCDRQGVVLMEAFMYRYHPRTERVAALVADWDVRGVEATFHFPLPDREDVRLEPDLAGGSLMDVGCYAVNLVRLVLGDPDRVSAHTHDARDSGVDTHAVGLLRYDDGRLARVSAAFDTRDVQEYRIEAADGVLTASSAFVPRGEDGVAIEYERGGRAVRETFDPVDQYRLQVEHFVDCVREGRRPRTDARDAAHTLAVIDALQKSADRGETVPVSVPESATRD
jgi:predicted dehydrogenase